MSSESHSDFGEMSLDLEAYLVTHPSASFFMRVESSRYEALGIKNGDLVLVDRAASLSKTSLVVIASNDAFLIKPYTELSSKEFQLWGVVTAVIRKL